MVYYRNVSGRINSKRLKTTNVMERLNEELKRKIGKIGVFSSEASLIRLVTAIMMDINEEWSTGKKYINMQVD